ncbi:hypothetical protein ACS0TY_003462 [Phlomoides rotata]
MDPCEYPVGPAPERVRQVQGRRSWSRIKEDALIHCLTDVVNDGWKAENGFRAGFKRELERGMKRKFPGTDIVATPHINSKIHMWKKEYGTLSDLLSKSGIWWNSTASMIDVEDEPVWEGCRWADPNLKVSITKLGLTTHNGSIYSGKNRATGENAVDPIYLANEMGCTELEAEGETIEKYVTLSPGGFPDLEENSICKPNVFVGKTASKGKKRKSVDLDLSNLVDTLGDFMKHSKDSMGDVSKGSEKRCVPSNESKHLIGIMKGIAGLKISDKLKRMIAPEI